MRTVSLALFFVSVLSGTAQAQPATAGPATGDLACRANLVRLWVSIPPSERAAPWFAPFWTPAADAATPAAVRAQCLQLLDIPLVQFEQDMPGPARTRPMS